MSSISIQKKIYLGFFMIALLMFFSVLHTQGQLHGIKQTTQRVASLRSPIAALGNDLINQIQLSNAALNGWMLTADPLFKRQRALAWQVVQTRQEALGALYRQAPRLRAEQWGAFESNLKKLSEIQGKLERIANSQQQKPAELVFKSRADPLLKLVQVQVKKMISIERSLPASMERKKLLLDMSMFGQSVAAAGDNIRGMLLTGDPAFKERYLSATQLASATYQNLLKQEHLLSKFQKDALKTIRYFESAMSEISQEVVNLRMDEKWDRAHHTLVSELIPLSNRLMDFLAGEEDAQGRRHGGVIEQQKQALSQDIALSAEQIDSLLNSLWGLCAILLLCVACLSRSVSKSISRPAQNMKRVLEHLKAHNVFSIRAEVMSHDELGDMANSLNELLERLQSSLNETNRVVSALARGDLSQRIQTEVSGDLEDLKCGINGSIDTMVDAISDLDQMMRSLAHGQLNSQLNTQAEGVYGEIAHNGNLAVQSISTSMQAVVEVMDEVAQGAFNNRITHPMPGDFQPLKKNINTTLECVGAAIKEIIQVAQAMANKDLSVQISGQYHGELCDLSLAINQSMQQLSDILEQVKALSVDVSQGVTRVLESGDHLSTQTQEQASYVDQTLVYAREIAGQAEVNAQYAQQMREVFASVMQAVESGHAVTEKANLAMRDMQHAGAEIEGVTEMISSIAFQTNMLALNAAVEATRAGEQGKGFAVVADEVRRLALQSSEASNQIKALITRAVDKVDSGATLVGGSGEALQSIGWGIEKANQLSEQIARSSAQQSTEVREVFHAMDAIGQRSQNNVAVVAQAVQTVSVLRDSASSMAQTVAAFEVRA